MTTVFIAGSISISRLHEKVEERINKIVSSDFDVVVGDADGADTSIQECLLKYRANKVTVYCTGEVPRNNVAEWPVHRVSSKARLGTRAYFTAKDLEMARRSDYGLMIWDCKSTGTLSNVVELLREKKKSVVFVNKKTDFITICDRADLDYLLTLMSAHARAKAETKMGLSSKLVSIGQEQFLFKPSVVAPTTPKAEAENPSPLAPKPVSFVLSETLVTSVSAQEGLAHSQSMKLRSIMISALKEHISRARLSQSQAAMVFGVTQPRISDLCREKIDLFGLDALVNMAMTAGLRVEMRVYDVESPARPTSVS